MTISTSAPSRMMSNKPSFGRDVGEFLRGRENAQKGSQENFGVHITALVPLGGEKITVRVAVSSPYGREENEFVLLQELNREINTIGSKANDLTISSLVIDVKAEFEKIREQVQNIE